VRVRDQPWKAVCGPLHDRLDEELDQVVEPPGVVVVPVGGDNAVEVEEVDLQSLCVSEDGSE